MCPIAKCIFFQNWFIYFMAYQNFLVIFAIHIHQFIIHEPDHGGQGFNQILCKIHKNQQIQGIQIVNSFGPL